MMFRTAGTWDDGAMTGMQSKWRKRHRNRVIRSLSGMVGVAVLFGCSGREHAPLFVSAEVLEWRTEGGGNLYFDVRRETPGEYRVEVSQTNFRPLARTVLLTRDKSLPVFDLLERVFAGKEDLAGIEVADGGETGTWTSVYVVDPEKQRHKITSSHLRGELYLLRSWVEAQLATEENQDETRSELPERET